MSRRRTGYAAGLRWGAGGVVCCATVVVGMLSVGAWSQPTPTGVARDASFLAGVPVAGKTPEEVKTIARDLAARLQGLPLGVRYGQRLEKTTPEKLGAKVDIDKALAELFDPNAENSNLLDRIRERFTGPDQRDVALPITLAEAGVAKGLQRFSIRIGAEPRDARLTLVKDKLTPIPPKPGKELDPAALAAEIQAYLDTQELRAELAASRDFEPEPKKWLASTALKEFKAALRPAQPRITVETLAPITMKLTGFTTSAGGSSRNRLHNITLACKAIDGVVLLPGDEFSYNDVVGPRVPSAGFREAPVIVRGKLEPGTGGGICQVSSTLYNAALYADMEIVRRRHHAFPVKYVPAGRDATVVDGVVDFKFKNRLEHPVAIVAKLVGAKCVVSIYGHPDDDRDVTLASSRISRVSAGVKTVSDSRLTRGRRVTVEPAKDGRRVTVSRL